MKVVCIGAPKTGTSTMCRALRSARLRAEHGTDPNDGMPYALMIQRAFVNGKDPLAYIPRDVEAITDANLTRAPAWGNAAAWPLLDVRVVQGIRARNPEMTIILHRRDSRLWLNSVDAWKDLRARLDMAELPGKGPHPYTDDGTRDWLEGLYRNIEEAMQGDPKFLSIDIADPEAPEKIGRAIGRKIKWWGRENRNAS